RVDRLADPMLAEPANEVAGADQPDQQCDGPGGQNCDQRPGPTETRRVATGRSRRALRSTATWPQPYLAPFASTVLQRVSTAEPAGHRGRLIPMRTTPLVLALLLSLGALLGCSGDGDTAHHTVGTRVTSWTEA